MRESTIQRSILEYLELQNNCYFFRSGAGSVKTDSGRYFKSGKPGCPDIVCCYKGYFIGLEVKQPKKYQSEIQKKAEKNIKNNGGYYFVVRSINDVKEALKGIK